MNGAREARGIRMTVHSPVAPLRRGASRGLRVGPGAHVAAFLTVLMLVLLAWPQIKWLFVVVYLGGDPGF